MNGETTVTTTTLGPTNSLGSSRVTNGLGVAYGAAVLSIAASCYVTGHRSWPLNAILIALGLSAIPIGVPAIRRWLKATATRQGFVLTFLVVPILLALVVGIAFTLPGAQLVLIRVSFILVACLLPATMYYLFIVTRKGSVLNEFVANMGRLGLLRRGQVVESDGDVCLESEVDRVRRVDSYLQKFEAAFGPLSEDLRQQIMQPRDASIPTKTRMIKAGVATVFVSEAAVPVMVATFFMALLWVVTLPPVAPDIAKSLLGVDAAPGDGGAFPWLYALAPNLSPVTAAFLGSYFFCLQLLFRRYVRRDLRPSAYVGCVYRMVIAVIGIWVLDIAAPLFTVGEVKLGLIVTGFSIGVFPRVLFQLLQGVAKKLVPAAVLPSLKSDLPISDLDGLTVWHEARLEDEDIENVPNMATADLLDLMVSTRFPADRLIDWIDQAILFTVLGPQDKSAPTCPRAVLRLHGIRTASGLCEAYRRAVKCDNEREAFEKLLSTDPRSQVRSIVDEIETFPSIRMIRVWRRLPPESLRTAQVESPLAA
jgi:hypothetical protein